MGNIALITIGLCVLAIIWHFLWDDDDIDDESPHFDEDEDYDYYFDDDYKY